jgi:hypothetical protein
MKCSLEIRINTLSKRMQKLNECFTQWKSNHRYYGKNRSATVERNQRLKLHKMERIWRVYTKQLNNLRSIGGLNITTIRKDTNAPRHLMLLTRCERKKLVNLLNQNYRFQRRCKNGV